MRVYPKNAEDTTYFRNFFGDFLSVHHARNFEWDDADGDFARDDQRVRIEMPVDNVGLICLSIFFFDQAIHGIQCVESIRLLLAMNENRVGELGGVFTHVENIVGEVNFLGVLDICEGENSVAVHFVELANFFGKLAKIFTVGESTQQLAVV